MAEFVPCYTCRLADSLFGAMDVTDDGRLSWEAVEMRACWALDEYGDEIANADDLFQVVFKKLLLPLAVERAMLRPGDKDVAAAGEEAKLALSGDFPPTNSCKKARRSRGSRVFSRTLTHDFDSAVREASGKVSSPSSEPSEPSASASLGACLWGGTSMPVGEFLL